MTQTNAAKFLADVKERLSKATPINQGFQCEADLVLQYHAQSDLTKLTAALEVALGALDGVTKYSTKTSLSESEWDYICGKILSKAMAKIEEILK